MVFFIAASSLTATDCSQALGTASTENSTLPRTEFRKLLTVSENLDSLGRLASFEYFELLGGFERASWYYGLTLVFYKLKSLRVLFYEP